MNFPLFHDPFQGAVAVDAQPVRDPQIRRQSHNSSRAERPAVHGSKPIRSARQREVAKVAEDLRALMASTAAKQ